MIMRQEKLKLLYNISTWDKIGLNFWGVPKAGDTSIKYLLHQVSGSDILESDDKTQWVHNHEFTTYISPDQAIDNGFANIAVTRNPYSRFISMWKDVKRRGPEFSLSCKTIDEFLFHIENTADRKRNVHFRSQSYFLRDIVQCIDITDTDTLQIYLNHPIPHKNILKGVIELSDRQKERVYNVYKNDFEYLGYNK